MIEREREWEGETERRGEVANQMKRENEQDMLVSNFKLNGIEFPIFPFINNLFS